MAKILKYLKREEQYYPTPKRFIKEILSQDKFSFLGQEEINFLDVGAGSGNISDVVKEKYDRKQVNISCIEINEVLSNSLKGKGYKIVGSDFREYPDSPNFDLIFMNPPFKYGTNFTLKAYKNLREGGRLISIVNAESIKNPFSNERKLLVNMIESQGEVEFFDNIFSECESENKTDVEIAVIIIEKPSYEGEFDFLGDLKNEVKTDEDFIREEFEKKITESDLVQFNKIDSAISLYRNAVKQLFTGIDMVDKLKINLNCLGEETKEFNIEIKDFFKIILEESNPIIAREKTVKLIRKMIWSYIIKLCDMDRFLFSKQREQFYKDLDNGIGDLPFTKDYIQQFFDNIFYRRNELFKEGVIDLFNTVTNYHSGNRFHTEGWKTNKNWKINKKIIVPWGIQFTDWSKYGSDRKCGKFDTIYSGYGLGWLGDLDKMVRLIDKPNFNSRSIIMALNDKFDKLGDIYVGEKYDNTTETYYFNLKFWKKGTLHIMFKDQEILDELNKIGANLRMELGYDT